MMSLDPTQRAGARPHRRWLSVVAVAALLALALTAVFASRWSSSGRTASRSELIPLVQAVGTTRPIEGRLTGGFAYGPPPSARRGAGEQRDRRSAAVLAEVALIERRYLSTDDAVSEAAWGSAALVAGDVESALPVFQSALSRAAERADVLSDASAAFLAAATQLGRDDLWVQGLDKAEHALELRPNLAEALFNKALALEGLSLHEQARAAWDDYLAADVGSPWAAEARERRLALVRRLSGNESWQALQARVVAESSASSSIPDRDVAPYRQQLRLWIEHELLSAWARDWLGGKPATAAVSLRHASAAADLLRRAGGDPMPAAETALIARAVDTNRGAANGLATAHLALPDVTRLSDEGAYDRAADQFERIVPFLVAVGSPYAGRRILYRGVSYYMARDLDTARATLATLDRTAMPGSSLSGFRDWMLGLVAQNQHRWGEGRDRYLVALRRFEALGESDAAGRVSALIAESYADMGDARQTWKYERVGLEHVPFIGVPRYKHLILQLGGIFCLRIDAPRAALTLQHAVIEAAKAYNRTPSLIEGYLHRASILQRIGHAAQAEPDLAAARALLSRIDAEMLRRREEAEIDAAEAEVYAGIDPARAADAASRALAHFETAGGQTSLTGLYLLRARSYLAQGQSDRAAADFAQAIDRFEALRDSVLAPADRVRLFRDGWNAYQASVQFAIERRHDSQAALELAERARARTLLEALMGPSARSEPIASIAADLPVDVAVLFFVTGRDRLWTWTVTHQGIQFFDRPVALRDLETRISRVQRLLASSSQASDALVSATLRSLFTDLIEPVQSALGGATTVVVVPDGPLHRLPFAALLDPRTGHYLIESRAVAVAPSLTTLRLGSRMAARTGEVHALVVGDPAIADGSMPRLRFGRDEAVSIAGLYPGSRMLLDAAATRAAFLAALPDADVVHYTGHAIVDSQEPDRSHLLLAVDADDRDGRLPVTTLRQSMLPQHPIVVLAACSTNGGPIVAGEGVLSLARPFLEAGARTVLATLWDVADRDGAALFTRFHAEMARGVPATQALADAQRAVLRAPNEQLHRPASWSWAVAIGGSMR